MNLDQPWPHRSSCWSLCCCCRCCCRQAHKHLGIGNGLMSNKKNILANLNIVKKYPRSSQYSYLETSPGVYKLYLEPKLETNTIKVKPANPKSYQNVLTGTQNHLRITPHSCHTHPSELPVLTQTAFARELPVSGVLANDYYPYLASPEPGPAECA